jgi:dipeptidyl aminopeptidase/acylaminoacyl peptidase
MDGGSPLKNHSKLKIAAACALVFCSSAVPAQQASKSKKTVEARLKAEEKPKPAEPIDDAMKAIFAAHRFAQAAISPDGKMVAWVETLLGKDGAPDGNTAIYVASTDASSKASSASRKITAGISTAAHAEGNVVWSPDSQRIAFLSDAAKSGQLQLYITNVSGAPPKKLTAVKGLLAAPRWSPDGKTIAVLFTENATRAAGPLVAETPETGEIKDAFFEQRLALVDVVTGKLRQISPADTYIYEYDWSPDGLHFIVTAALGNGDNNWWIADLSTLDATSGLMKSIYKPKLQIARPAWSPDGQNITFVEGLMSDEDSVGGDVHVIPAAGGPSKNITPEMKASASWLAWTSAGNIIFGAYVEGDAGIYSVSPAGGKPENLYRGSEELTAGFWGTQLSISRDGNFSAAVRDSLGSAPEIWAGPIGQWKQITHRNDALKPAWGEAKNIRWKSDSFEVQGWLIYPRDFDPSKKYPLVVKVHGGPSSAVQSSWPGSSDYDMALPAAGYFVFAPNPRGSFGQGEAFTRANVKDFGYGDWRDVMSGIDEVLKQAPIDPNRLGLTGWSYGGYMSMWGVTQTNRFKAAVAGAGIANLQSYYGQNQIDQWMIPFFGKSVYDDPEVYAKSSPITFIKKVKTPTLILVGDSDGECPTPQSYEFWHALKTLGVETQLVVYEREGHHFVKPAHQRDRIQRTVAWFDAHLK